MEEESSCFPLCSGFLLRQTTTACSDLVHDLKAKELLSWTYSAVSCRATVTDLTHQGNKLKVPGSLWFQVWWEREQFLSTSAFWDLLFWACTFKGFLISSFCALRQPVNSNQLRDKVWPVFLWVKIIFPTVKGTKSAISTAEGRKRNFLLITENCIELNCFTSVVPLQVNLFLIQNKIISRSY